MDINPYLAAFAIAAWVIVRVFEMDVKFPKGGAK